uniref:Transcription initiation factor TFIID complex subunit TAF12 n=1 Tax=Toxoplasma gondii TgCATBr9 TaxID=943120 RepID=A0A2T6IPT6_TOXGO|nr:transcription initiation factor TFIID complex subunit TAF12 [Toxoplasma gondii TgCATBr9]
MSESACIVDCPEVCPLVPAHTPSFAPASLSANRQEVSVEEVFSEIHAELVAEALKDLDPDAELDSSAATLVGDLLDAFVVDTGIQAARICRFRRGKTLTREDLDFCLSRNFAVPSTSDLPVSSVVSSTVSSVVSSSVSSSVSRDTGGWRPLAVASPLSSFAWGRQRRQEGDPSESLKALVSRQQETHTRLFHQILQEQKEGISGGLSRGEGGRKIRIRTLVSQKGSAQKGVSWAPGDREEKKRVRGGDCTEAGEDSDGRSSASPQGGEGETAETGVSAKKSCVASDGRPDAAAASVSTDLRPSGEEQTEARGGQAAFGASADGGGETPVSGDRAAAVGCGESREGIREKERDRPRWNASSCASLQEAYFGNAPGPQDGQQMDLNRHTGGTGPSASAALAPAALAPALPPSLSQSPASLHAFAESSAQPSNPKPLGFVADVSPVCAQGGDSTPHSSGVPVSHGVASLPLHARDLPRPAAEGLVNLPVDYSQPYPSLPSSLPPFASPYFPAGLAYPPVAQGPSVTPHDSHFFASGSFLASPLAPFRHPRRQQGYEGEELAGREALKL